MTLIKNKTAILTVVTAFVLGVMFAPAGYSQPVENVVVTTNGLTFEENGEPLSIIGWVENTSPRTTTLTDFETEAAAVVGNCGVNYLNVAMIKGVHTDIQNYKQLLALKDQYINFEYEDSDTKLPCRGMDRTGINSVELTESKSIEITSDVMSKRLMNLYFNTDNPTVSMADATIVYNLADSRTFEVVNQLGYGKQDIEKHFDVEVTREQISETERKIIRNSHDFTPGEYTIIGSTMSGSISEPVVITMYPNQLSTTSFTDGVLYSILGLLGSAGIVGTTLFTKKKNVLPTKQD